VVISLSSCLYLSPAADDDDFCSRLDYLFPGFTTFPLCCCFYLRCSSRRSFSRTCDLRRDLRVFVAGEGNPHLHMLLVLCCSSTFSRAVGGVGFLGAIPSVQSLPSIGSRLSGDELPIATYPEVFDDRSYFSSPFLTARGTSPRSCIR